MERISVNDLDEAVLGVLFTGDAEACGTDIEIRAVQAFLFASN